MTKHRVVDGDLLFSETRWPDFLDSDDRAVQQFKQGVWERAARVLVDYLREHENEAVAFRVRSATNPDPERTYGLPFQTVYRVTVKVITVLPDRDTIVIPVDHGFIPIIPHDYNFTTRALWRELARRFWNKVRTTVDGWQDAEACSYVKEDYPDPESFFLK